MTFADLMATTSVERWASLPVVTRDAIGAKLLEHCFAELVAEDDGLETTIQERNAAGRIRDDAFQSLFEMVEAAFPTVMWTYPGPVTYEARDRHGNLLGIVSSGIQNRFLPTSPRMKKGRCRYGTPIECLPRWARRGVTRGGWFGAVLEDGTRYPDDYRTPALVRAA